MTLLALRVITALTLCLAGALVTAAFAVSGKPMRQAQTRATATPAPQPKVGSDWILLDNVPPGSPQLEYGREIYRLACSACHGDNGQGLTTKWRMTWAPEDQNCWQSKCHGLSHPPDGFFLPYSPPVTNLTRSGRYPTALELQDYIREYMPWQDPGSMLDERAWQVTAYVLKLNNIDAGPVLDAETALKIRLAPAKPASHPQAGAVSSDGSSAQDSADSPANAALLPVVAALAVILLFIGGVFWQRRAKR